MEFIYIHIFDKYVQIKEGSTKMMIYTLTLLLFAYPKQQLKNLVEALL